MAMPKSNAWRRNLLDSHGYKDATTWADTLAGLGIEVIEGPEDYPKNTKTRWAPAWSVAVTVVVDQCLSDFVSTERVENTRAERLRDALEAVMSLPDVRDHLQKVAQQVPWDRWRETVLPIIEQALGYDVKRIDP